MTWVERSLWVLAWSVWALLGAGLFHQLPRDLGPVVARLPFEANEWAIGFLEGSKIATFRYDALSNKSLVRRWNARSGTLEQVIAGRPFDAGPAAFDVSPNNRFLAWGVHPTRRDDWRGAFVTSRTGRIIHSHRGREIIDLLTSERTPVPDGASVVFHPTKPWAAIWQGRGTVIRYIRVLDLETDRLLAEWNAQRLGDRMLSLEPWFVGDDRLATPVSIPRGDVNPQNWPYLVEVWKLASEGQPLNVLQKSPALGPMITAAAGRFAWYTGKDLVEVADVEAGRVVFTEPALEQRRPWGRMGPGLSDDGRTVLSTSTSRLFDVDAGRLLWAAAPEENILWIDGDRRFEVAENWRIPYTTHVPPETFAVRDLHNGRFLWRTWKPTLQHRSADANGELLIIDNEVRTTLLCTNWSLLSLCQFTLALPLLMLWVARRWRRRTKASGAASGRRGAVEAAP